MTAEKRMLSALRPIIWGLALLIAAAILLIYFLVTNAFAHDPNRPELNSWYKGLNSGKGPCCDGSDYQSVKDPDWESRAGRYRVRLDGQWVDVPPEAVINGPNMDGRTLVWPLRGYMGVTVRCFMPGAMI